jgi:KEOPS complex subunit Cgi121
MRFHLKEFGKYLEIAGYKNTSFDSAEDFLKSERKSANQNVELQFFDADLIATEQHLFFAVLNALEAFKNKNNLSKSLAMETMLYASASRQIQKAISQCGIKPETTKMAAIIINKDETEIETVLKTVTAGVGGNLDKNVLKISSAKVKRIKQAFHISDQELETATRDGDYESALVNLVIEHMALLATQL